VADDDAAANRAVGREVVERRLRPLVS